MRYYTVSPCLFTYSKPTNKKNFYFAGMYLHSLKEYLKSNPIKMAAPKLNNVPIKTYSVSFLSLASFRSPNRKIDFAARRNPIAAHWLITIKIKTSIRSKNPIYFPALCKEAAILPFGIRCPL